MYAGTFFLKIEKILARKDKQTNANGERHFEENSAKQKQMEDGVLSWKSHHNSGKFTTMGAEENTICKKKKKNENKVRKIGGNWKTLVWKYLWKNFL